MPREEPVASAASSTGDTLAAEVLEILAGEIGPRRPTSSAERTAASWLRDRLAREGLDARAEPFSGYASFGWSFGAITLAGVLPGLLPRRWVFPRALLSSASLAALVSEGGMRFTPLSRALSRRPSQNVVATLEPQGEATRTLCLVCHLDTSRSGLMFHPAVVSALGPAIRMLGAACAVQAAEPLLGRVGAGRALVGGSRAILALSLALLAERELRGVDVPGANDNASGVAVASQLAAECAADPPRSTRIVLLATGCEESALLGAQAFLREHDTSGWLFVNFDSVGGPATLRYALKEGVGGLLWPADEQLVAVASELAWRRPELGLEPASQPIGLTYDTTPVLARGGRALTFVAGNGTIPNYHWPTDTVENVDRDALACAIEVGREMIRAIDRGEAD
jgi:hypothetical protein